MPRFRPAFWRTFRPGSSRVPRADRVMLPIRRSSTLIRSNRRAISVLAFSVQSLRRSASRARSRARASRTRPRQFEPRRPGQACAPAAPARALPHGQAGDAKQVSGRQGRGHCHAPVDAHGVAVTRRRNRPGNYREGNMPAPGPVHRHPVRLHPRRHGPGPAEPHPTGLRHPHLPHPARHPAHVPLPPALSDDAEPLVPPGLAPSRPLGRIPRVEEGAHSSGEVPQRLLLHHLRAPRSQSWSARAAVSWRHCSR